MSGHVYYTGNLAADCDESAPEEIREVACAIRETIWKMYEDGAVLLVQRRVAPFKFDYLAIPTRDSARRGK